MFLVWSLIDRSIELAPNLVPFKGLLSLFIDLFCCASKRFLSRAKYAWCLFFKSLLSHGLHHSLNNAISPLSFDYIHTLHTFWNRKLHRDLSFLFRRPNQFSQQLGYWQESRGRALHVSVLGSCLHWTTRVSPKIAGNTDHPSRHESNGIHLIKTFLHLLLSLHFREHLRQILPW